MFYLIFLKNIFPVYNHKSDNKNDVIEVATSQSEKR